MAGLPTLVNYTSGASVVAAPASFALTIPATAAGSIGLLFYVIGTAGAATFTNPPGFTTRLDSGNSAGLEMVAATSNGAITTGTTTLTVSGLANLNSIACAFYELGNMSLTGPTGTTPGNIDPTCARSSIPVSATSCTTSALTNTQPSNANGFLVACIGQLTGQALTRASTPSSIWINDAAATSTTGATNVVITPQHAFLGPSPLSPSPVAAGTFGGAIACVAQLINMLSSLSAPYVLVEAGGSGSSAVHAMGAYAGGIGG